MLCYAHGRLRHTCTATHATLLTRLHVARGWGRVGVVTWCTIAKRMTETLCYIHVHLRHTYCDACYVANTFARCTGLGGGGGDNVMFRDSACIHRYSSICMYGVNRCISLYIHAFTVSILRRGRINPLFMKYVCSWPWRSAKQQYSAKFLGHSMKQRHLQRWDEE